MSKIYKVRLYDGFYKNGRKDYQLVGNIIVKKTTIGVFDVLTGFKLSVFKDGCIMINSVDDEVLKRNGHQPFISQADLVQKNLATVDEIDEYVDNYSDSNWNNIYEEMKLFTITEKVVINRKVKSIFKSRM